MDIIEIAIRSVDLVDKEIDKHGRKNLVCTLFYLVSHEFYGWHLVRCDSVSFLTVLPSIRLIAVTTFHLKILYARLA